MQTSELENFWTQHLDAWHASGLSQNAYCRKYNLRPSQLSYWKRKLAGTRVDHKPVTCEQSPAFVPLSISHQAATGNGLRLPLPNGCELAGIEGQHLPLVIGLMKELP
jgi:hypothetical protein